MPEASRCGIRNMSAKRRWAKLLYPRYFSFFEKLNKNVLFDEVIGRGFRGASEFPDRFKLYDFLNARFIGDAPIDYLEFGVWEGGSIKRWCQLNTNQESRFYGFDTFEGLPEDWNKNHPRGSFRLAGKAPMIGDSRARCVEGLFQETLCQFLDQFQSQRRLVVHIDCDLYSATLFCLTVLDRYLTSGSLIIFDEFRDLEHEFSAFWDYARSYYKKWEGVAFTPDYTQAAVYLK
jgi:O-methyltransferase